ncbi:lanthionine synthetase C family protein [Streptomyces sp. NPDC056480]|uniref:lanthionine synthetase C family protein n=1 Tax=Streptomyces sp. NPDC056480 TaxID=3345833 RepID=UPI0036B44519
MEKRQLDPGTEARRDQADIDKARARRVIAEVAERVTDAGTVMSAAPIPMPAHVALPGCALLMARLASEQPSCADAAVEHLRAISESLPAQPNNVFQGTVGAISTALAMDAMTGDRRLSAVVTSGARSLSDRAESLAQRYASHQTSGVTRMDVEDFDTVSGLAGLGRVLMLALHRGYSDAEPGLRASLEVLTGLLANKDGCPPGWWPSRVEDHRRPLREHGGAAELGMAHGIAGPLAFLAVSLTAGNQVAMQREAVRFAAEWLLSQRHPGTWTWPASVTAGPPDEDAPATHPPAINHTWCSGSTGIATAIHLAGRALNDPVLVRAGTEALSALTSIPRRQWAVRGPALCCGFAGVLQAALTATDRDTCAGLGPLADIAAAGVLDLWDPASTFGFRHQRGTRPFDSPEFLYGAAGTALALYDYTTDVNSSWPGLLLLG